MPLCILSLNSNNSYKDNIKMEIAKNLELGEKKLMTYLKSALKNHLESVKKFYATENFLKIVPQCNISYGHFASEKSKCHKY